jgi:ABC-type antimicrobial peptide transport system permease subunit
MVFHDPRSALNPAIKVGRQLAEDYVMAARMLGVPRLRILSRHVLPNMAEPLVISVTLSLGSALLSFAALSFIGLGVQLPAYDWGELLNQGLGQITVDPGFGTSRAARKQPPRQLPPLRRWRRRPRLSSRSRR